MPRLTPPYLLTRPITYSSTDLRIVDLRSSSLPAIENLSVLQDAVDSYDLTDNDIQRLEMPRLNRCEEILISNNSLTSIAPNLAKNCPNLKTVTASRNSLTGLASLLPLLNLESLTYLDLTFNPCCTSKYYR